MQVSYEQTQLFYTAEEVTAKISDALAGKYTAEDMQRSNQRAKDNLNLSLAQSTLNAIKELVSEGTLDRETAVEVYNKIADYNSWSNIETLARKFEVSVQYQGTYIGEFTVEADDEDSAIEYVSENMEVTTEVMFNISLDGYTRDAGIDVASYDYDLDLEATEVE